MQPSRSYLPVHAIVSWVQTPEQQADGVISSTIVQQSLARYQELLNDSNFVAAVTAHAAFNGLAFAQVEGCIGTRLGDPRDPMQDGEYADTPERVLDVYRFYNPAAPSRDTARTERAQQRELRAAEKSAFALSHATWLAACAERRERHTHARDKHKAELRLARERFDRAEREYRDEVQRLNDQLREETNDPAPEQPKRQA